MTVDDYLFWWNDMVLDQDVPVNAPFGTTVRGELMTVAKVDDYSLQFSFPYPNPLFLDYVSHGSYHSSIHIVPNTICANSTPDTATPRTPPNWSTAITTAVVCTIWTGQRYPPG